jgi:two-component system phosphate regulon sensor histidine kinase PhoR
VKPLKITIIASLILSSVVTGLFYLVTTLFFSAIPILGFVVLFIIVFLLSLASLKYLYSHYIFNNLNSIYRDIIKLKNPNEPIRSFSGQGTDITNEIQNILVDWSKESKQEIDNLKQVEIYRREFLSNVSHELKTPIFSAQGYIHTLIDGGIEDADINVLYLNKAAKSIDRLVSMVDDLESISKLEAGELIVEIRTFDITDLIHDVIDSLEIQSREKKIKLHLSDDANRPVYVNGDRDLVRQVVVNLLVNSVKYGVQGGETMISYADGGDKIIIDIADNGIGIEKGHLPRLFERFYRVDKSRSRDQGGTGLGLAIVKHIIEAHNQYISVHSEVGKGTTFSFSLQLSK